MDRQGNLRPFRKCAYFLPYPNPEQTKLFRTFRNFLVFFLADQILFDQIHKNMDRQGILRPYRKCAYFPAISEPRAKGLVQICLYIFLTDSILSSRPKCGQVGKFKAFQEMGLLPTATQTQSKNIISDFSKFCCIFFIRPNIIRSSRQKYGQIGNFKAYRKMGPLPIDIRTPGPKNQFRFFNNFLIFLYRHTII